MHPKDDIRYLRDAHLVSGQRAGFVRAYNVRAAKSLDAREVANNRVLLSHLLRAESETCRDDGSKTLRNSGDGERNSNLEVVHRTLKHAVVRGIPEVTDVNNPDENADDGDDFG